MQENKRPAAYWLACVSLLTFILPPAAVAPAQTGSSAATQGRLFVPGSVMAGHCTTRVSPRYPAGIADPKAAIVTLRVVISRSGSVSPMYRVSGPAMFETEAMDAVRLWKCVPYVRKNDPDSTPIDVLTQLDVTFTPGQPSGLVTHLPQ